MSLKFNRKQKNQTMDGETCQFFPVAHVLCLLSTLSEVKVRKSLGFTLEPLGE
jgi:hypothetical protein